MDDDNVFYVGIGEPNELRKDLLGCSKTIISCLKDYENYKDIRAEKDKVAIELKKAISEIIFLNEKLTEFFPKTRLRAMDKEQKEEIEKRSKRISGNRKRISSAKDEDIKRLEEELSAIEERLSGI